MSEFAKEKDAIVKAMVAYKVDGIKNAAEAARKAGMPATAIIDAMGAGMSDVGVLSKEEAVPPHVLSAANGMSMAVKSLEGDLPKTPSARNSPGSAWEPSKETSTTSENPSVPPCFSAEDSMSSTWEGTYPPRLIAQEGTTDAPCSVCPPS